MNSHTGVSPSSYAAGVAEYFKKIHELQRNANYERSSVIEELDAQYASIRDGLMSDREIGSNRTKSFISLLKQVDNLDTDWKKAEETKKQYANKWLDPRAPTPFPSRETRSAGANSRAIAVSDAGETIPTTETMQRQEHTLMPAPETQLESLRVPAATAVASGSRTRVEPAAGTVSKIQSGEIYY